MMGSRRSKSPDNRAKRCSAVTLDAEVTFVWEVSAFKSGLCGGLLSALEYLCAACSRTSNVDVGVGAFEVVLQSRSGHLTKRRGWPSSCMPADHYPSANKQPNQRAIASNICAPMRSR
ncbi:hypothetical protein IG631_14167 [Alternaria alternata]|nr:hypothetical protein IG631_14167 [Alternaria alternata]